MDASKRNAKLRNVEPSLVGWKTAIGIDEPRLRWMCDVAGGMGSEKWEARVGVRLMAGAVDRGA
eukprot:scaffold88840_cov29-Tisochrysis_lutea.AAC.2